MQIFFFPISSLPFHFVNSAEDLPFVYFCFVAVLLVSNPKNPHQDQCQGIYCLCFLLGVLWFQVLCSNLNPFWVNFYVWYKIVVQFQTFVSLFLSLPPESKLLEVRHYRFVILEQCVVVLVYLWNCYWINELIELLSRSYSDVWIIEKVNVIFVFMMWWERQILNKWPVRIICGGHHQFLPFVYMHTIFHTKKRCLFFSPWVWANFNFFTKTTWEKWCFGTFETNSKEALQFLLGSLRMFSLGMIPLKTKPLHCEKLKPHGEGLCRPCIVPADLW